MRRFGNMYQASSSYTGFPCSCNTMLQFVQMQKHKYGNLILPSYQYYQKSLKDVADVKGPLVEGWKAHPTCSSRRT